MEKWWNVLRWWKVRGQPTKTIKVGGLMTAPRHEIVYARNIINKAFNGCGIPLTVSSGVFYGQCMQSMLEDMIATTEIEYAITVDYDSLFIEKDLRRLLRWMVERPDIDAIAGMEMRRGKPSLLGTVPIGEPDGNGNKLVNWNGEPIEATTAHFGLTVLSLEKLKRVPKPWFWSKPNADGEWKDDKVDDDTWFWLQWKKAGNTIYIDPGVRIGHMEEMVTTYDDELKPVHMYPKEWEEMANAC